MRISVVICTVARAASLRRALAALRHQTHADFEVVVVAGPAHDETEHVLAEHADAVRVARNDRAHLSRSRNFGIELAAGELVAFLDDDAIPDPGWLAALASAFDRPGVVGAGGLVRDADGSRYQYGYSLCTRSGHASHQAAPPLPAHMRPGADPFLYLQGTNACFRRDALCAVGGFDEEIEFFHDETDLCARLIDAGGTLRVVRDAQVIHKHEASHVRDAQGRVRDPFPVVKNRVYFAHRHAARQIGTSELETELSHFADIWRAQALDLAARGTTSAEERDWTLRRIDDGIAAGDTAGRRPERRTRPIGPPDAAAFAPFPLTFAGPRRRVVFVSSEFPPGEFGGIGRFTQDLAAGLAERGCETHVVVPGAAPPPLPVPVPEPPLPHPTVIDFEDGAWVHRVPPRVRAPRLAGRASHAPLEHAAAAYHEVAAIEERFGEVDVASAPVWSGDGLALSLDPRRPVVTTLMTTLRTVVGLQPSWQGRDVELLLALEAETLRRSRHFHAISEAILSGVRHDYPVHTAGADARVLHIGVRDRRAAFPATPHRPTRILFVGRLERRKGVDLLLDAATSILARRPDVELVLAGKDTPNTELGITYREWFAARHPELGERVRFAGTVSENELYRHYAGADIFAAPSRYESFGLVHVEAMMMGLPVVACRTGGLVEVVADGETGLLVPPDDAAALEAALERLVDDPELRERFGSAGRTRYEREFAHAMVAERTATAYAQIADAHHRRVPDAEALALTLAASIERAANVRSDVARRAAEELLRADRGSPLDVVGRVWDADAGAFVDGLYEQLLGRVPSDSEREQMLGRLAAAAHRGELVRDVGWSPEAAARGLDRDWLGDLLELPGWTEELACAVAFAQPSDERFAQDLADLLVAVAPARAAARTRLTAELTRGTSRRDAALCLLGGGSELRSAPDFSGWAPMLNHVAATAKPSARLGAVSASSTPNRPSAVGQLRARAGVRSRVLEVLDAIRDTRDHSAAVAEATGRVEAQLRDLAARVDQSREVAGKADWDIYKLLGEAREVLDVIEHHATIRSENVDNRFKQLDGALQASGQHVDTLQRKLEAMAIDLRDRLPVQPPADSLPEPVIRDEARLHDEPLRVNLGAGEKPVDGYVNVDMRPLERIDVVADVRRLPFAPGSISELMSAHLVEHFREHHLEVVLLPYWRSLLRHDGVLRIVTPDWESMTARLHDGRMSWAEYKVVTFGMQDYEGDDHFALYTPASLTRVLEAAGFTEVEVLVVDRMNGLSPEMELVAQPGGAARGASAQTAAGRRAP